MPLGRAGEENVPFAAARFLSGWAASPLIPHGRLLIRSRFSGRSFNSRGCRRVVLFAGVDLPGLRFISSTNLCVLPSPHTHTHPSRPLLQPTRPPRLTRNPSPPPVPRSCQGVCENPCRPAIRSKGNGPSCRRWPNGNAADRGVFRNVKCGGAQTQNAISKNILSVFYKV